MMMFLFSFPYLEKNQSVGEFFGVEYKKSSEWSTDRKKSGLMVFQNALLAKITGVNIKIGDIDFIKSFRQRQRNPVAEFEITLKKGERSLTELEREVVAMWHYQLKDCYQLPLREDEKMVDAMIDSRRTIQRSGSGLMRIIRRFTEVITKREKVKTVKNAFKDMTDEEKTLYMIPFLTTIDTFMICLSFKTFGNELSDFFDRVPVKYVPMFEGDTPVLCRLDNNMRNNPGNSVFGPTGVVCPGSNVTTQILNAIKNFCNNNKWEVRGTPVQNDNMIAGIVNTDEIFINIL
jgi:hypothetical protein